MRPIRNVAIIAHVDHGKTTLVDGLLRQTGALEARDAGRERILDSNDLERERGITIFSKACSIEHRGVRIHIIDTPGHADFGGEVERVLRMVDGALLVVDAAEGPMPQTRYVLRKALAAGLGLVLILNKCDRPAADPRGALDKVIDLLIDLGVTEDQLEFPIIYASARDLWATRDLEAAARGAGFTPLLDAIVESVPPPPAELATPFRMLVTWIEADDYLRRIAIGRVHEGRLRAGEPVVVFDRGGVRRPTKVTALLGYQGLGRVRIDEARAGEVVALGGVEGVVVGDTVGGPEAEPLPTLQIDSPTLSLFFGPNTSPFAGREGTFVTSRKIRERLMRESENNLALAVEDTARPEVLEVSGRGELHLSILIETMRREGYEMELSKPQVILRTIDGVVSEPYEEVVVETAEDAVGAVIEAMGRRKGTLDDLGPLEELGTVRLRFAIPTRSTLGLRNEILTLTAGRALVTHAFIDHRPHDAGIETGRRRGVMVSKEDGVALSYALNNLQERGTLFIGPGTELYQGMIVGENSRDHDMDVNACKGKHMTNIRAAGSDEKIILTTPRVLTLEESLAFINADELVEVTPRSIRLRKRILDGTERRVAARA